MAGGAAWSAHQHVPTAWPACTRTRTQRLGDAHRLAAWDAFARADEGGEWAEGKEGEPAYAYLMTEFGRKVNAVIVIQVDDGACVGCEGRCQGQVSGAADERRTRLVR